MAHLLLGAQYISYTLSMYIIYINIYNRYKISNILLVVEQVIRRTGRVSRKNTNLQQRPPSLDCLECQSVLYLVANISLSASACWLATTNRGMYLAPSFLSLWWFFKRNGRHRRHPKNKNKKKETREEETRRDSDALHWLDRKGIFVWPLLASFSLGHRSS